LIFNRLQNSGKKYFSKFILLKRHPPTFALHFKYYFSRVGGGISKKV